MSLYQIDKLLFHLFNDLERRCVLIPIEPKPVKKAGTTISGNRLSRSFTFFLFAAFSSKRALTDRIGRHSHEG